MYTNKKRSANDQYNETSNHRQMKGYGGSGGSPGPGGPKPCRCRRPLSFVYGLMSHCIDRFHFVFYLYTFHFMLPMCILGHIAFSQVHLLVPGTTPVNCVLPLQMEHCHIVPKTMQLSWRRAHLGAGYEVVDMGGGGTDPKPGSETRGARI